MLNQVKTPGRWQLHLAQLIARLEGWIKRKDEHCKTIASLLLNLFEAALRVEISNPHSTDAYHRDILHIYIYGCKQLVNDAHTKLQPPVDRTFPSTESCDNFGCVRSSGSAGWRTFMNSMMNHQQIQQQGIKRMRCHDQKISSKY